MLPQIDFPSPRYNCICCIQECIIALILCKICIIQCWAEHSWGNYQSACIMASIIQNLLLQKQMSSWYRWPLPNITPEYSMTYLRSELANVECMGWWHQTYLRPLLKVQILQSHHRHWSGISQVRTLESTSYKTPPRESGKHYSGSSI